MSSRGAVRLPRSGPGASRAGKASPAASAGSLDEMVRRAIVRPCVVRPCVGARAGGERFGGGRASAGARSGARDGSVDGASTGTTRGKRRVRSCRRASGADRLGRGMRRPRGHAPGTAHRAGGASGARLDRPLTQFARQTQTSGIGPASEQEGCDRDRCEPPGSGSHNENDRPGKDGRARCLR